MIPTPLSQQVNRVVAALMAAALVIWVTGCATTADCDPSRDPGLLGAIGCQASGRYAERNAQREAIKADEQAKRQRLTEDVNRATDEQRNLDQKLGTARGDLTKVQRELNVVEGRAAREAKRLQR